MYRIRTSVNGLWLLLLGCCLFTLTSCEEEQTYAEQKKAEYRAINSFIQKGVTVLDEELGDTILHVDPINWISEEKFYAQDSTTDLSRNEYVRFNSTGIYMQIVRRGTGEKLNLEDDTVRMLCRYKEFNISGDSLQSRNDNAYFIGIPSAIEQFSQNFVQRDAKRIHRVMVIGAGRTGRALASLLDGQDVEVKVVEKDHERCQLMAEKLDHGIAICGDGTDIDLLLEEGVAEADVVVCLTEDDKLNLMLALLAKHLGADKTVVRVARNEYVDLMEKVGVDVVLSARLLSASEVLAFARRGGVVSVSLLEGAKAEAVEVIMQEGAPAAGKPLMDAKLPKECLVCAYVRAGEAEIPNGTTVLLPGDRIILFIQTQFAQKVMKYFKGKE